MLRANVDSSHNGSSKAANPTYAVILENPPKDLDDPVSRKDFLVKFVAIVVIVLLN